MTLIYGQVSPDADSRLRTDSRALEAAAERVAGGSDARFALVGEPPRLALGYRSSTASDPVDPPLIRLEGLTICADMRLDNRDEVARELDDRSAGSLGDVELVRRRWAPASTAPLSELVGDFALAVWDEREERLVLARDALGVRPLYYARAGRGLVFASDIEVLAAHPLVEPAFDLPYTASELTVKPAFFHATRTLRRGIRKVAPGHLLTFDASGLQETAFWSPDDAAGERRSRLTGTADEVRHLVEVAVRCRLPTGPAAVHVSGGLDSSAVFAIAARQHQQLTAISWSPPRPSGEAPIVDERTFVSWVVDPTGVPLVNTDITPGDLLDMFTIDRTILPFTGPYPEWVASREAATSGASVVLSGWGGDELISGLGPGYLAELLRTGHWWTLWREASGADGRPLRTLRRIRRRAVAPCVDALRPRSVDDGDWVPDLPEYLDPTFRGMLAGTRRLTPPDNAEHPGVAEMQRRALARGHLAARLEGWAALGYRRGIVYRFPLLDRRVVELALRLPGRAFVEHGERRVLFRSAMSDLLPAEVLGRTDKREPAVDARLREVRNAFAPAFYRAVQEQGNPDLIDPELAASLLSGLGAQVSDRALRLRGAAWLAFVPRMAG